MSKIVAGKGIDRLAAQAWRHLDHSSLFLDILIMQLSSQEGREESQD